MYYQDHIKRNEKRFSSNIQDLFLYYMYKTNDPKKAKDRLNKLMKQALEEITCL